MDALIGSRVLVKLPPKKVESVELFEATDKQEAEGEVVLSAWADIGVGSIVIFNKYAGHEVEIDGVLHKLLFISNDIHSEVLAVKTWVKPEPVKKKGGKNAKAS